MKGKIGNRLLGTLTPGPKPFDVCDTDLTGFILRVEPGGAMTYFAAYRLGNRKTRYKIGSTQVLTAAQARDRAKEVLADVTKGIDPAEKKRRAEVLTLRVFLTKEYGPWLKANCRSGAYMLKRLEKGCESLLDSKLTDINPWVVEKWRREYLKREAIVSSNRHLAYLKACLTRAVEWGFLHENPILTVKRSKEDVRAKIRYLTPEEEAALMTELDKREMTIRTKRESHNEWCRERGYPEWPSLEETAFADYLKPMILLSLHTGMRRGEVFSLAWQDVDLGAAMLTIRGEVAKSALTRHIPLNKTAHAILKDWKAQGLGYGLVFPAKSGKRFDNVGSSWETVLTKAGIVGFRWHDMRHTFASRLVMAGVDLNTVRELLGHSDIKMTLRYAHLAPQVKAAAVERLVTMPTNIIPLKEAAQNAQGGANGQ